MEALLALITAFLPLIILGSILTLNIWLARQQGRSVTLWVGLTIVGWIFATLILVVTRHTAYLRRDKKMNLMGPEEIEARYRQREDINRREQLPKNMYFLCLIPPVAVLACMRGSARKLSMLGLGRSILISGFLCGTYILIGATKGDWGLAILIFYIPAIIHASIVVNRENYWRSPVAVYDNGWIARMVKGKTQEEREKERQQKNREALIAELTDISGVGDELARAIVGQFPTRESITGASEKNLTKVLGVGPKLAREIKFWLGYD